MSPIKQSCPRNLGKWPQPWAPPRPAPAPLQVSTKVLRRYAGYARFALALTVDRGELLRSKQDRRLRGNFLFRLVIGIFSIRDTLVARQRRKLRTVECVRGTAGSGGRKFKGFPEGCKAQHLRRQPRQSCRATLGSSMSHARLSAHDFVSCARAFAGHEHCGMR